MSAMNFNDRVVIVTGAGGGLGAAYANFFASRGAKVGYPAWRAVVAFNRLY